MRLILCSLLFTTLGCSGIARSPGQKPSSHIRLTSREEGEWRAVLKNDPQVRHLLRRAADPEEYLRQEITLRRFLNREYRALCPPEERAEILRNAKDAAISRAYRKELLRSDVHVTPDDARKIFDEHPDGWNHPPSVGASEIFLWAPTDLPELRSKKAALIRQLRDRCSTREAFEEAARKYSEATSAYRGGKTGTIEEDQVSGAIHDALFSGNTGISDLVETPHGFYLFFITKIRPARRKSFEQVEEKILSQLRGIEVKRQLQEHLATLQREFELHEDSKAGGIVLKIGEKRYSAEDLELLKPNPRLIRSRAIAILEARELAERGIKPESPNPVQVEFVISQRIFDRLLEQKLKESPLQDDTSTSEQISKGNRPDIERWSFDLLRIENADRPEILFRLYRVLHDEHSVLKAVASRLRKDDGVVVELLPYREVLPESVAGLGPEIHTTLKTLQAGETSHPLHPRQSHDLVVCHMIERHPDPEATHHASQQRARSRRRRMIKDELRREILEKCGLQPTRPRDSSSQQERSNR